MISEGYMPYLGYQTYYRIVGEATTDRAPLVLLHGGPGSTHNYFELLDDLARRTNRQLIMYDQLGCGLSQTDSRPDLWTSETWIQELIALMTFLEIDEYHLLGQSWGGMMAIEYLCDYQPTHVKSLILSSTLPSAKLWSEEQHRLIRLMPPEHQEAIAKAEGSNDFSEPAYLAANAEFMRRHAGDEPTPTSPEPLRRLKTPGTEAYLTAWGPNEFYPNGNLHTWEYRDKLATITVPTLITSGTDDLSTPLIAKTMLDGIPDASWQLFANSRHMPFVEETSAYLSLLTDWLTPFDHTPNS